MKPSLQSTKRSLIVLAVFVALGAGVNCAVALACGLWASGEPWMNPYYLADLPGQEKAKPLPGRVRDAHDLLDPPEHADGSTQGAAGFGIDYYFINERPFGQQPETGVRSYTAAILTGWPVKSFWGYRAAALTDPLTTAPTIIKERERGFLIKTDNRWIPCSPIWSGVIINTAFYSTILLLLWLGPRGLRRWWRHRHGRCPSCGYILGCAGASCPECGIH